MGTWVVRMTTSPTHGLATVADWPELACEGKMRGSHTRLGGGGAPNIEPSGVLYSGHLRTRGPRGEALPWRRKAVEAPTFAPMRPGWGGVEKLPGNGHSRPGLLAT